MICTWPGCTGVHDNNRYAELCPRSRRLKAIKDERYQAQAVAALSGSARPAAVRPAAWAPKADWQQLADSQLAGIYLVHD